MPSPIQFAQELDDTTVDPDLDMLGIDDADALVSKKISPTNVVKGAKGVRVPAAVVPANALVVGDGATRDMEARAGVTIDAGNNVSVAGILTALTGAVIGQDAIGFKGLQLYRVGAVEPAGVANTGRLYAKIDGTSGATELWWLNSAGAAVQITGTDGGLGGGGVTDHGALTGLGDDDHAALYFRTDGARAMAGALDMGAFAITNVGLVDGVNVSAHATRHGPGGADPIAQATTSDRGTVELSTQAETAAGLDAARVPSVLESKRLTYRTIWQGNFTNRAVEVGAGGADVGFQPPWTHDAVTDPTEADNTSAIGWQWINTANGKIWQCVKTGGDAVWRCMNIVVETDNATTTRTMNNTYDGSIKRMTGASAGIAIEIPAGLNNGLSCEFLQENPNDPVSIVPAGGSGVNIRVHAASVATSDGQWSSLVVTVLDTNDVLVRARGPLAA